VLTQARATAEKLLGRHPDHLEPYHPSVGGDDSHAFRVWLGREAMLLKIKKRPGSPVGVCFHRRLKEAGLPVPELIAFSADAGPGGEACAIWEWIEGAPAAWEHPELCPYDEAEFGGLLRRIHELRADGRFGLLADEPGRPVPPAHPDLGPTSESWAGFFHCDVAAQRYFDRGYLDLDEAEALACLPDRLGGELGQVQPRLLHMGDIMHNGNMIVEPSTGRILAVVDYCESMAGDPRWELAWVDYYFAEYPFDRAGFDMPRFRAGYGTDHDPSDRLSRFYLAAILVFEKLLFFDPTSPRGQWAIGKVKEIVRSFDGGRASASVRCKAVGE